MFVCGYSLYCRTYFYNGRAFLYWKIYKIKEQKKDETFIWKFDLRGRRRYSHRGQVRQRHLRGEARP